MSISYKTIFIGPGVIKLGAETYAISKKTSKNFEHNGFKYKLEKNRGQRSYLRCLKASKLKCKARLVIVRKYNMEEITTYNDHNHSVADITDKVSARLLHKGALFYKHYTKHDKQYWRCAKINSHRCPARLCTTLAGVEELNCHNHSLE